MLSVQQHSVIPVVGELVHQAVEEGGAALAIHPELSPLGEVVTLSDVLRMLSLSNPHLMTIINHPCFTDTNI